MPAAGIQTQVAVQGELGSYSELAAHEFFAGPLAILPCPTFAELFAAVAQGRAGYGMAPVENSLAGSIHPVWDLLAEEPLPIAGEILLRIDHCLIAHPGTRLEEVRRIYSHPQALAQCQEFLGGLKHAQAQEVYDTAGAVKLIKEGGRRDEAAIASAQAAVDHGMAILAENIQTDQRNYTRFLVLGHRPVPAGEGSRKSTMVLDLGDTARALPAILAGFTSRQCEVLKVELRKRLGAPWEYRCYLEVSGDAEAPPLRAAIAQAAGLARWLRVIGSYAPGQTTLARLHPRP
jgi:prephenate dehydratase